MSLQKGLLGAKPARPDEGAEPQEPVWPTLQELMFSSAAAQLDYRAPRLQLGAEGCWEYKPYSEW